MLLCCYRCGVSSEQELPNPGEWRALCSASHLAVLWLYCWAFAPSQFELLSCKAPNFCVIMLVVLPEAVPAVWNLFYQRSTPDTAAGEKLSHADVLPIAPYSPLQFLRESSYCHWVNQVENWCRLKARFLFFFPGLTQVISCISFPGWALMVSPWHSGADSSTLLGVNSRGRLRHLFLAAYPGLLLRKLWHWQSCFAGTKNCSLWILGFISLY